MGYSHGENHNLFGTPEYVAWCNMKTRCYYKNSSQYKDYGGRGIIVCDRWVNSFINFLIDMGKKPSLKHSLDRIDNSRGYFPDNCRWATASEQNFNRRPMSRSKRNANGLVGITFCPNRPGLKKWRARMTINHKMKTIGYFLTSEQAVEARKMAQSGLSLIKNDIQGRP